MKGKGGWVWAEIYAGGGRLIDVRRRRGVRAAATGVDDGWAPMSPSSTIFCRSILRPAHVRRSTKIPSETRYAHTVLLATLAETIVSLFPTLPVFHLLRRIIILIFLYVSFSMLAPYCVLDYLYAVASQLLYSLPFPLPFKNRTLAP